MTARHARLRDDLLETSAWKILSKAHGKEGSTRFCFFLFFSLEYF